MKTMIVELKQSTRLSAVVNYTTKEREMTLSMPNTVFDFLGKPEFVTVLIQDGQRALEYQIRDEDLDTEFDA